MDLLHNKKEIVMEQYIKKSALVAEIERLRKNQRLDDRHGQGVLDGLHSIERFIDTLEAKEMNLEEKATQLSQKYFPDEENIWARANIEAQKCKSACIEMVEWLKAQKGE